MDRNTYILIAIIAAFFILKSLLNRKDPKETIQQALTNGALVIDVRTPAEFKSRAYPRAKNIPLGDLDQRINELGNKDQTIVLYCASGARSGSAKRRLIKAGYTNALNAGGLHSMPAK